ncbi:unnamed protein product [Periconia digitata]|uniref:Methyltransferase n=1 Tax=Periconia digitata TaxID=1303443 RepID=A0A9W4XWN8_9PLEO|nr:unnamed protein product [Periconia digitata]
MTKPWPVEWKESFDFVHQRLALAAGGPMQKDIVNILGGLVKPGGWIQLIEASNEELPSHGPAFKNFVTIIKSIYTVFRGSLNLIEDIPAWLKEAGFVDVEYKDIDTKLGALNPNPQLAKQGVYSTTVAAKGLAHFASTLPAGAIPLTSEQIANHPDELKAELAKTGAIYPLRIIWGRKLSS